MNANSLKVISLALAGYLLSAPAAHAISCGEVPSAVRGTFVSAFQFYKTYLNPRANSGDAYRFAVRMSYAHSESTYYPLAANDESYSPEARVHRLKGLEISQDLARIDNGGRERVEYHKASLRSYYETFQRGPYTIKKGGFNTKYAMVMLKRPWAPGDVVPRFDVASSTNFGMMQISSDQAGLGGGVYRNVLAKIRELSRDPNQVAGVVDWCRSKAFFKDSNSALRTAFMQLANSGCHPGSGDPMCFGRWQLLCPTYNVLMGAALPEAYFAGLTKRAAQPLCQADFF